MFRLGKYENDPKFITLLILILIGSIVCMLLILVGASGPASGFLAIAALIAILVLVDNRAADETHTTREDPDDRDFW
jgi:hypothetical protein